MSPTHYYRRRFPATTARLSLSSLPLIAKERFKLGRFVDWLVMAPSENDQRFLDCQNPEWAHLEINLKTSLRGSVFGQRLQTSDKKYDIPAFLKNLPD